MAIQWKWLFWQVAVPIVGPIVVSAIVILAWMTGSPGFKPDMGIIVDVSPWALTFYMLGLIGSTIEGLWPKLSTHPVLGLSLIVVAFAVGLYAAFIVVWRHDSKFIPGLPVYFVTGLLFICSVALCHAGNSKK